MYVLRPSRAQIFVFYGLAAVFVVPLGLALEQADFKIAAMFAALAVATAVYGFWKSFSSIHFDASEPRLTIRNGFSAAVTIHVSDVVRCDLTRGNARVDKLTYRIGGQTKDIVPHGGEWESLVAWAKFCDTYVDAVRSEQARAAHHELMGLDADPRPLM